MDETVRGEQPAGRRRWLRAAQWARENPDHANAKKYVARRDAANAVAASGPDRAWEHWRKPQGWQSTENTYEYQTCSTRCAMLQLQLDLGVAGLEALQDAADPDARRYVVERPADSKRRGKCKVCESPVPRPAGSSGPVVLPACNVV